MLWFGLVLAPFYLNDIWLIPADSATAVLAVDYGSRILSLAILFAVAALRFEAFGSLAWPKDVWRAFGWIVVGTAVVVAFDKFVGDPVGARYAEFQLFRFPKIESELVRWADLTVGLFLVAISEELVFRPLFAKVLQSFALSRGVIIWISALAFSAIHWSGGLGTLATALVAGILFMEVYLRIGSVLPLIAAHFLVNFILFV